MFVELLKLQQKYLATSRLFVAMPSRKDESKLLFPHFYLYAP